jgi:hypothetical protein
VEPDTWEQIIKDAVIAAYASNSKGGSGSVLLTPFIDRCKALAGDAS